MLPSVLVLDNSGISCIGDKTKLKEMCHNTTELDLTKNHLTDWGEVYTPTVNPVMSNVVPVDEGNLRNREQIILRMQVYMNES